MIWKIKAKLKTQTPPSRQKEIISLLLKNRGLDTKKEINQFLEPPNPLDLSHQDVGIKTSALDQATKRIAQAIEKKQHIVIYGDYDADGICATAILWETLFQLKAIATPFIPHREKHGYGLSTEGIQDILTHPNRYALNTKPDLIITVDNGIVAQEAAKFTSDQNIDLIITDHHQPGTTTPKAQALVHTDKISGSGVAWFLSSHLAKTFKSATFAHKLCQSHLDLLAIGTIADLMPMVGINRSLAKAGLKALTFTQRPGFVALKNDAHIDLCAQITAYHVGFIIGPRINAMGRLKHGIDALRLLCTKDQNRATKLAKLLGDTNRTRQQLTNDLVAKADQIYRQDVQLEKSKLIIIQHQEFHEGVIGLIARKLTEKYHKPAIVISRGSKVSKASARSVGDVNIIQLIRTAQTHLLNAGGHPAAAGFTVKTSKISALSAQLINTANSTIDDRLLQPLLSIDCQVKLSDLDFDLYHQIQRFQPFGLGNPRPTFASSGKITDFGAVGNNHAHLKLKLSAPDSNIHIDAIGFRLGDLAENLAIGDSVNVAFTLDKNNWNNNTCLQLVVKDLNA